MSGKEKFVVDWTKLKENKESFEKDIRDLCTAFVVKDKGFAKELWGSIANVGWSCEAKGMVDVGLSFRHIAGIIAEMRNDGTEYIDWYMCISDSHPTKRIIDLLGIRGWKPSDFPREHDAVRLEIDDVTKKIESLKRELEALETRKDKLVDELIEIEVKEQ